MARQELAAAGANLVGMTRRMLAAVSLLSVIASISVVPASTPPDRPMLVAVRATPEQGGVLASSFDLVETRMGDELVVVVWPGDLSRLKALGLRPRVLPQTDDLAAASAVSDGEDREVRTTYRTYSEYQADLKRWATTYPEIARTFELSERTLEGRPIAAIEIAIGDADDGRPKAYFDGIHHAREWPAGELVMSFVEDLLLGASSGDPRITDLLTRTAVIAVPVVNPDGFTISRETPVDGTSLIGLGNGFGAYWRKNARGLANSAELGLSVGAYGVDNNRNYPFRWGSGTLLGGYGASGFALDATYEGAGPSSEPETTAVRELLLSTNQTAMITNHTYGNLVLWPWGHTRTPPPDIAILRSVGERVAQPLGYRPQPSMDLYATTGTTDDWAYAATGTLGLTLEHGTSFHPPYGPGVMFRREPATEAFLRLVEAAADPTLHSVIRGRVVDAEGRPSQGRLSLLKDSSLPLWGTGGWCDSIDLSLETRADGTFTWHVNPSVGPIDTGDYTLVASGAEGMASLEVGVARGEELDLGDLALGDRRVSVPTCAGG